MNDLPDSIDATCRTCSKSFAAAVCRSPFDPTKVLATQRHCDPCLRQIETKTAEANAISRAQEARRRIFNAWEGICPIEFRNELEGGFHDEQRFFADQPAAKQVTEHPYSGKGLILRGQTDAGKTRAMWCLMRRYWAEVPRLRLIALSAGQFDREARDAAGTFTLTAWFDRLARADALFIDDIGKGKWTPATSGQFWELVDDRCKHHRPIYLTTNLNGETLVTSLGLERDIAEPLLRRLRQYCDVIVLKKS